MSGGIVRPDRSSPVRHDRLSPGRTLSNLGECHYKKKYHLNVAFYNDLGKKMQILILVKILYFTQILFLKDPIR